MRTRSSLSSLLALSGLALLLHACADQLGLGVVVTPPEPPRDRPLVEKKEGYARSDSCASCHPREYGTWAETFHSTMTQEVTPETVMADFGNRELEFHGKRYRLERRGDEFWVEMEDVTHKGGGPPPRVWRQIVLTTGSHHFQSYWYPEGKARKLNFLPICWRIDEGRWIPVRSAFLMPDDVELPMRGRWNTACQTCHTVAAEPRLRTGHGMDTRVTEHGIACEACHGPGEAHVEANQNPLRRYRLHAREGADDTIVEPTRLGPELGSQVCGQCHAFTDLLTEELTQEWRDTGFTYEPGEDLRESRAFLFEGDNFFWPDGMVRLAGREFNALLRTPCFTDAKPEEQMGCHSCHRMHQDPDDPRPLEVWRADLLEVGMDTNEGCTQCHPDLADPEELVRHTNHPLGGGGSSCYDCHMPHTAWSLLGACRSHEVNVPSVQESVHHGRPNACNLCHLDRTLSWSSRWLKEWWDVPRPRLEEEERTIAAGVLWALRGDAGQRALAAWHMGWQPARDASGTDWMAPYLAQLLHDPYEAVRFTAVRSLQTLEGTGEIAEPLDFLEKDALARAAFEIRAAWEAGEAARKEVPQLLLTGAEGLDREVFEALLVERDDTPVVLSE